MRNIAQEHQILMWYFNSFSFFLNTSLKFRNHYRLGEDLNVLQYSEI